MGASKLVVYLYIYIQFIYLLILFNLFIHLFEIFIDVLIYFAAGDLPIHIASREGNHHVVDELLKLDKSLANSTNGQGLWHHLSCSLYGEYLE